MALPSPGTHGILTEVVNYIRPAFFPPSFGKGSFGLGDPYHSRIRRYLLVLREYPAGGSLHKFIEHVGLSTANQAVRHSRGPSTKWRFEKQGEVNACGSVFFENLRAQHPTQPLKLFVPFLKDGPKMLEEALDN